MIAPLARSLSAWDKQQVEAARECAEGAPEPAAQYELDYKVLLDTPRLYSVAIGLDVYCGGPHHAHVEAVAKRCPGPDYMR